MTGPGSFEPIFPAHAIERCTASVFFHEAVPGKVLERLRVKTAPKAAAMGLMPVFDQPAFGMQISVVPNQMVRLDAGGGGPSSFASDDRSLTLTTAPNFMTWQTTSYVRWDPFIGQFDELVAPLLDEVVELVAISVVKLEYVDRFFWTDEWEGIDYGRLLLEEGDLLAHRGPRFGREWHSHVGWFQPLADRRRLVNVNVDVVALPRGEAQVMRPSVGILTFAQDQPSADVAAFATPTWAEGKRAADVLEEQHDLLKELLGGVITAEAAAKIGLRSAP